jgi:hypothetical protein
MERTGAYVNLRKFTSPENGSVYSYFHIEGTEDQVKAAFNWVKTIAQENYDRRTDPRHVAPERGTVHYPSFIPKTSPRYNQNFPTLPGHSGVSPPLPPMPPLQQNRNKQNSVSHCDMIPSTVPTGQPQPNLGFIPPQQPPMAFAPGQFFPNGVQFPMMPPAPMFYAPHTFKNPTPPVLPPQPDPSNFPQQYLHPPPDDPHHFTEVGDELDIPYIAAPCGCQVDLPADVELPDKQEEQRSILDGFFGTNNMENSAQCPHCPAPLIHLK